MCLHVNQKARCILSGFPGSLPALQGVCPPNPGHENGGETAGSLCVLLKVLCVGVLMNIYTYI